MKKRYWFVGIGVAVIAALMTKKALDEPCLSAEDALEYTKRAFSAKGNVQGAWISASPEIYTYDGREYDVYKGGISVLENDEEKTYDAAPAYEWVGFIPSALASLVTR